MKRMLAILCLLVALPASAQIYKWVDENGRTQFSDKPPVEVISKPKAAAVQRTNGGSALPVSSSQAYASLSELDPSSTLIIMRNLLERRQFDELNKQLQRVSDNVKQDVTQEAVEAFLYTNFPIASQRHLALANEWIAHSPQNYSPYLVRAYIYYAMAWNARGSGYAKDMSDQSRAGMLKYVDLLKTDVTKALSLNGHIAPSYILLINSNSMTSNNDEMHRYYKLGTAQVPASYLIHSAYMNMNSPRWGGSYEYLENISVYASEKAHLNPRLATMIADALFQVGKDLYSAKKYEKAISVFDQAVERGFCPQCYKARGDSLSRVNRHEEALDSYNTSLTLNPYLAETYYAIARAYRKINKFNEALEAIHIALKIDPLEKRYLAKRSDYSMSLATYNVKNATTVSRASAENDYALTEKVSPHNSELAYTWHLYFKQSGDLIRGHTELEKAIAYNPDCFKCVKALDNEIARYNQDWPRILELWKRYLARNPNDADALLEVAGTSYHMKDYAATRRYAQKSLVLGNEKAKQYFRQ